MASEEEANAARQQHGRDLLKQGVHGVGVEEGRGHGQNGWVVVAHVAPGTDVKLPATLSTANGDVPLVTVQSESFKPE
jgi:hypothetical protein